MFLFSRHITFTRKTQYGRYVMFVILVNAAPSTGLGQKVGPRLGEFRSCCCLPHLPGLACNIHASWGPSSSRTLYQSEANAAHSLSLPPSLPPPNQSRSAHSPCMHASDCPSEPPIDLLAAAVVAAFAQPSMPIQSMSFMLSPPRVVVSPSLLWIRR